uniref:Uncharacterized protein n=1 Tax=Nelumbo nucifera TaxID=4432 RepID=A0A822YQU6_NELNU|nr:TPA_asm: hypothetical protein HUJ06_005153 [Nelumbo nucifera]
MLCHLMRSPIKNSIYIHEFGKRERRRNIVNPHPKDKNLPGSGESVKGYASKESDSMVTDFSTSQKDSTCSSKKHITEGRKQIKP